MCFFHLNFINVQGTLAQKLYNVHAIFHQFSENINRGWSQQPSILCQLVTGESQRTGISCPKESLSLTNATLFLTVFFACCVRNYNYINP